MIYFNVIWVIILLAFTFIISNEIFIKHRLKGKIIIALFLIHLILGLFYYNNSIIEQSDAYKYYIHALDENNTNIWNVGTKAINTIVYIFIHYLGFNYLTSFLFFIILGYLGFLNLYVLLDKLDISKVSFFKIRLIYIILLLPQFHFWTCALGKDSITFFLSTIIIKEIIVSDNVLKNKCFLLSSLFLFFIRPYLIIFMIISFFFSKIISANNNLIIKISLSLFIALLFFAFRQSISLYFGMDDLTTSSIDSAVMYYSDYAKNKDGSFIDPANTNYLYLIFSYLFRPLFYDAKNISQLLSSIENLILLFIFFKIFRYRFIKSLFSDYKNLFLLSFFVINILIKSYTLYNIGLASRQKYIVLPYLFVSFFYYLYREYSKNICIEK